MGQDGHFYEVYTPTEFLYYAPFSYKDQEPRVPEKGDKEMKGREGRVVTRDESTVRAEKEIQRLKERQEAERRRIDEQLRTNKTRK